jgi:hypothetical protein
VRRWTVGLACLLPVVGLAAHAQMPAGAGVGQMSGRGPAPPPAARGTGLILGQVVDGSTGQPISGATVSLTSPTGAGPGRGGRGGLGAATIDIAGGVQGATGTAFNLAGLAQGGLGGSRVLTDEQGHFLFHDLPAASFSIAVNAPGYVPGSFGQTRPNGPSRALDLAEGQRTNDSRVRLWKYAVVTGSVQDEVGQPAVGLTVRALRKTTANGRARLVAAGSGATTDDRGEFRLSTLVPGDYIIAMPETQVTMPVPIVQTMTDAMMSGRGGGGMIEFVSSGGPMPSPDGIRIGDNLLQSPGQGKVPAPLVDGRLGAYLSQYFPAALTPSQATTLTLRSGEEKGGVNLQLRLAATASVSGTVIGPDGPVANAPVKLTPAAVDDAGLDSGFETASTLTRADGSFVLLAVPAGQYTLRATKMPRPPMPGGRGAAGGLAAMVLGDATATSPGQTTVGLYAQSMVDVSGRDVAALTIPLREGAKVSGRIEFVGAATPPQPRQLQSLSVTLAPTDTRSFPQTPQLGPTVSGVDQSGQFRTTGYPPGRYSMSVAGPTPPGWTLKAIMLNGRDALTSPVELTTADLDGAVVTFSDKVSQIAGTVRGVPAGDTATVLVFPFDYKAWIANGMSPRRMRQTPAGTTGSYSAGGLFGADYFVAALDDDDLTDNLDPSTFDALSRIATRVTLADGEKKTVDLSVVRIK